MGLLDSVFAGESGVSSLLHKTLGGTAIIRTRSFERDSTTGETIPSFEETSVPFAPGNEEKSSASLNAPSASRSDVREPRDILSGSFPCASLSGKIVAERDTVVFNGVEYLIESAELLNVGDAEVQYSITARRIGAVSTVNNEKEEGTESNGEQSSN